ncbi:MAG: 50S ribosomal protein L10 [Anaerolineae bacterium]|nr:50S ribosomal protein L10 [Anaerolineae bacterium]
MAISRARKEELVEQYTERLQVSNGIIMTDYRGLRVAEMEQLRRSLHEHNVAVQVVKNRLLRLALDQAGIEMPGEWLLGPSVAIFCQGDVPPAAKVLTDFAKNVEGLVIKGGVMGAEVMSVNQVKELANLPSREVLLAQALGTINAPATQTASVVASGIRQVLNVLQAYVDKLKDGEPVPQAA